MSLLATQQDFEPANPTEGATALYYQPADGSGYSNSFPFFQARINSLKGRFAPNNQKLAIWGCGWGELVNLAVAAGYDAFGFDASAYAIARGQATQPPAVGARLFQRNALSSADVTASKTDAGVRGGAKFAVLVTEDLLTCMSDAEIQTTLPLLRGVCSANLLHVVSPLDPTTKQDARINWKTMAAWKALLTPDAAYDAVTNQVV